MRADEFISRFPAGYDERSCLALNDHNQVIVTHPEHPPLRLDAAGQWIEISENPKETTT